MTNLDELLEGSKRKLTKAIGHLEYSYQKILKLSTDPKKLDDAGLETWESFSARFSRVVDIYLTKYVGSYVLKNDPGFQGSLRDFIDQGEKLGVVDGVTEWMGMRQLRNISAHDYSEEELSQFFKDILKNAPRLLSLKQRLKI